MPRTAEMMTLGAILLLRMIWILSPGMAAAAATTLSGCPGTCGNITIPYPFGIGPGCYREGFELTCDQTSQPPKLHLDGLPVEVIGLSLAEGTVRVRSIIVTTSLLLHQNNSCTGLKADGPFTLSGTRNKFASVGCDSVAYVLNPTSEEYITICASACTTQDNILCQTSIPMGVKSFSFRLQSLNQTPHWAKGIETKAFLVENEFTFRKEDLLAGRDHWDSMVLPAVVDWTVDRIPCVDAKNKSDFACRSENSECYDPVNAAGYRCNCSHGYEGNPYIPDGCKDIDECENPELYPCFGTCINMPGTYECYCPEGTHGNARTERCLSSKKDSSALSGVTIGVGIGLGLSLLSISTALLICVLKKRNAKKLKEKFFKQNHGLLLQQMTSSNKNIADRMMKIFTAEELQKATNNFDESRIIGRGGHGTVYKGILSYQQMVAIKKSEIIVQKEIDQFINEIVIISQINHRNVVKLFGCCLETEVPLLVYEFISNGTLYHHLHTRKLSRSLSWEDRLRIAAETARALAYLHSAASIAVLHRDVKSSNILLDDNFTVKVSDFGASKSIPLDQSRITTAIQGTFGYLDPEYFHTSRFTDKSDVYSFGVILVELLTSERPIFYTRLQEERNLATHFLLLLREDRVFEILDPQVIEEGEKRDLEVVTALADKCLRLKGEDRPTMKEAEVTLEALRGSKKQLRDSRITQKPKECEILLKHLSTEVSKSETSRQYSLEKELILSSNFPR